MYFPEKSSNYFSVLEALRGEKVAVIGHLRPDGDSIGSQVALCRLLRVRGTEAVMVLQQEVPRVLKSFIGDTPTVKGDDWDPEGFRAICVDCADASRIGKKLQKSFSEIFLNIDHHVSNSSYAKNNFVEATAAATAEIIAGCVLDNQLDFDPITAQALYVGIATDTGGFIYPSTTYRVFSICGTLVERGAVPAIAARELYGRERVGKLKLIQQVLASLSFAFSGRVCTGVITQKDYRKTGCKKEDSEGLVNYTRSIEGVIVGMLIEERSGGVKVSLRASDPSVRVDQIAQIFGGGGHACAAGFDCEGVILEEFQVHLLRVVKDHLKQRGML